MPTCTPARSMPKARGVKRAAVQREADFYGAMDGAGKFVKGDAVAALVIVALNLAGGVVVGVAYHGLSPLDALDTFALLSIGNALVTTLPAFLISTAMGMMVTRVAIRRRARRGSGRAALRAARRAAQRGRAAARARRSCRRSRARSFLSLGLVRVRARAGAQRRRAQRARRRAARRCRARAGASAMRRPELAPRARSASTRCRSTSAPISRALLAPPLADALLDRIGEVRRALATEIGVVLPGVRLRDDLARDPQHLRDPRSRSARRRRPPRPRRVCWPSPTNAVAERAWAARRARTGLRLAGGLDRAVAARSRGRRRARWSSIRSRCSDRTWRRSRARYAAELLGRQELQTLLEHLRARFPRS